MAKKAKKAKAKLKTYPFDAAEYLDSEEAIAVFLNEYFADGGFDARSLTQALAIVARARSMIQLAKDIGISRTGLYKALAPEGNPSFETVSKIMQGLGVRFSVEPRAR